MKLYGHEPRDKGQHDKEGQTTQWPKDKGQHDKEGQTTQCSPLLLITGQYMSCTLNE